MKIKRFSEKKDGTGKSYELESGEVVPCYESIIGRLWFHWVGPDNAGNADRYLNNDTIVFEYIIPVELDIDNLKGT